MYGLTEAFRSTYLASGPRRPQAELDRTSDPGRRGPRAIDDLTPCAPRRTGQLVHRGPTVALGYWDDPEATSACSARTRCGRRHPERRASRVLRRPRAPKTRTGDLFFVGRTDEPDQDARLPGQPRRGDRCPLRLGRGRRSGRDLRAGRSPGCAHRRLRRPAPRRQPRSRSRRSATRELPRYMQPTQDRGALGAAATSSGKHDASGDRARSSVITPELETLLEPLERFESIRRRAVRLGDRLVRPLLRQSVRGRSTGGAGGAQGTRSRTSACSICSTRPSAGRRSRGGRWRTPCGRATGCRSPSTTSSSPRARCRPCTLALRAAGAPGWRGDRSRSRAGWTIRCTCTADRASPRSRCP